MWGLAQRCGAQLRLGPNGAVIGFDMTAVLAMADASGICLAATAEFMPTIEAAMVRKTSEKQDVD